MVLMEAEPFAASVGITWPGKRGDCQRIAEPILNPTRGILHVILLTAAARARASREHKRAQALERFLRAIEPETALKILNSVYVG